MVLQMVLHFREKADVLELYANIAVPSARQAVPLPAVLRVKQVCLFTLFYAFLFLL